MIFLLKLRHHLKKKLKGHHKKNKSVKNVNTTTTLSVISEQEDL